MQLFSTEGLQRWKCRHYNRVITVSDQRNTGHISTETTMCLPCTNTVNQTRRPRLISVRHASRRQDASIAHRPEITRGNAFWGGRSQPPQLVSVSIEHSPSSRYRRLPVNAGVTVIYRPILHEGNQFVFEVKRNALAQLVTHLNLVNRSMYTYTVTLTIGFLCVTVFNTFRFKICLAVPALFTRL